jgi:hypothetical protein
MAKLNARLAASRRSPRPRPSMTPSQLRAYLLARETLRRVGQAASAPQAPPARSPE